MRIAPLWDRPEHDHQRQQYLYQQFQLRRGPLGGTGLGFLCRGCRGGPVSQWQRRVQLWGHRHVALCAHGGRIRRGWCPLHPFQLRNGASIPPNVSSLMTSRQPAGGIIVTPCGGAQRHADRRRDFDFSVMVANPLAAGLRYEVVPPGCRSSRPTRGVGGNAGPVTFIRGGAAVALAGPDAVRSGQHDPRLGHRVHQRRPVGQRRRNPGGHNGRHEHHRELQRRRGDVDPQGTDTLADYQQVLQSVTYVDTLSTTANLGNRTLNFSAGDGSLSSPGHGHGGSTRPRKWWACTCRAAPGTRPISPPWPPPAWATPPSAMNSRRRRPVGQRQRGQLGERRHGHDRLQQAGFRPHGVEPVADRLRQQRRRASGITVIGESSPNATTATFTLSGALTSNKYYLALTAGGITDAAGATLDGEWTTGVSTFAAGSGNGAPGGNFNFEFYVLAGDVNGDGKVSAGDLNVIRSNLSPRWTRQLARRHQRRRQDQRRRLNASRSRTG